MDREVIDDAEAAQARREELAGIWRRNQAVIDRINGAKREAERAPAAAHSDDQPEQAGGGGPGGGEIK